MHCRRQSETQESQGLARQHKVWAMLRQQEGLTRQHPGDLPREKDMTCTCGRRAETLPREGCRLPHFLSELDK